MRKRKFNSGITLIALAVTITVMLILVGVTVKTLTGDNGMITAAKQAKAETKKEELTSEIQRKMTELQIRSNQDFLTKEDLESVLNDYGTILYDSDGNIIGVSIDDEGFELEISKLYSGEVGKLTTTLSVNFNGYNPGSWTNKDIAISLKGKNMQTGMKYQYTTNGGSSWNDCSNTITINTDQNQTYKFRILGTDGTSAAESKEYEVKRDTEGPTFSVSTSADWYTITVSVSNISDNASGVENTSTISVYHKYASESDSAYNLDYTGTNTSYTITGLSGMSSYMIKIEIKDNAGNIGTQTVTAGTQCFVAGTKVLTETGLKNIEDIKIGEKVWSINMDNNQRELKPVTNLFRGESDEIYELTIGNEKIKATPKHQFYIRDKGWIRAYDLQVGDLLVAKDTEDLKINNIDHIIDRDNPVKVYNMTIDGNHNYLITNYEILVHNPVASPSK